MNTSRNGTETGVRIVGTAAINKPELQPQQSKTFLSAIFESGDYISIRPIETWTDTDANGQTRKTSRVVFKAQRWIRADGTSVDGALKVLAGVAVREHANIFFGVCPRMGAAGQFELAWQIRVVRVLWADVDHTTVEDALAKCDAVGLPRPSIIVNSGNGVHLYWLLAEPYFIDDAGDPPAVITEWNESGGKRKPRRYYINEIGERVYLESRKAVPSLSAKAQHAQDVIQGISAKIGGDSTHDLARLLRIPGTLNRKDERNGREPMPCELVECDTSRRYPLADFEKHADVAPAVQRRKKIERASLPSRRKPTAKTNDKLAALILASDVAQNGERSEADFALCCGAIRLGVGPDEIWSRVQGVGKFAQGGERYFRRTWDRAERDVRERIFICVEKRAARIGKKARKTNSQLGDGSSGNSQLAPVVIDVDPNTQHVSEVMTEITDSLLGSGRIFQRTGQPVLVYGDEIVPILCAEELAGIANHHMEFRFIDVRGEEGQFKPLPASYGNTWLNHPGEQGRLPTIKLYTRNPVYTHDWRLASSGFDRASGIYYAGPQVQARDGADYLDRLLLDFCWKSPCDRTNYIGMMVTTLLVARFIGSKPAALFNGNQPELGKSMLAQILAILRDGQQVETASYNPNDEEFEKRLGSLVRRGLTTLIIDNAKGRGGRVATIDSPCLERSITDPILSFRLLGFSTDIRAENSHVFCITANSPDVARDLVTRSLVISLFFQGDPTKRNFSIEDPEGFAQQHRTEILGELIGMVERWKSSGMSLAKLPSRFNKRGWANTVGGILQSAGEPDFLANADEAASEMDPVRRDFEELVAMMADSPQGFWTAGELAEKAAQKGLLKDPLGDGSARSKATRMGHIATRYVAEPFPLNDRRVATFHKKDGRKGSEFLVSIDELPNP